MSSAADGGPSRKRPHADGRQTHKQMPELRLRRFKDAAMMTVDRIMRQAAPLDVLAEFVHHLSADCKLQQQVACHWMQPFCKGADSSLQEEIAARIVELMQAPAQLEVRTQEHNRIQGTLYVFGAELAMFGIPFDLLRVNYVAFACALRLMTEGHMNDAPRRSFGRYACSADTCTATWSEFGLNTTLSNTLRRLPFVISIMLYFVATANRADHADVPRAARRAGQDYSRATRVLLSAALADAATALSTEPVRRRCRWISDADIAELWRVSREVAPRASIGPRYLLASLLRQYCADAQKTP